MAKITVEDMEFLEQELWKKYHNESPESAVEWFLTLTDQEKDILETNCFVPELVRMHPLFCEDSKRRREIREKKQRGRP